ncbi:type VII secretion protein EccB [Nocardia sp. NPDC127579]|uniref:type VII secretion protein EccB n=1 Tax=Nocardia sp. NPDC127579 TaxID=3345402 RepID=UPI00364242C8
MPSKPTTRWQVSGYRFLVRRMEHALVRRDVRMLHDPMRSQSRAYAAGLVLGIVILAGCGILALLKPQGSIKDKTLLIGKESGGVYVVIDDVVHPALNLASAQLAADDPGKPTSVKESELSKKPRGQLIGIPGAPAALRFGKSGDGRSWSVCDVRGGGGSTDLTTTVIAGDPELGAKASVMPGDKALLVQAKDKTYLVYENKRAEINMNERAVTDALGITGEKPQKVSDGLINAIPPTLPIKAPEFENRGGSVNYTINNHRIGDVVEVPSEKQYLVVLSNGLQEISKLTADIIKNSNPSQPDDSRISQNERSNAPVSNSLQVQDYPKTAPKLVSQDDQLVSCMSWKPIPEAADNKDGKRADLNIITGLKLPIPDNAKTVPLAQADGSGPNADSVYIPPATGAFVQTTGIEATSRRKDSLFYIADTGVRYGIKDARAQKALGMDADAGVKPEPAPWQIIELLANGPTLGREEAMVAHDGVSPDPSPAKQTVGKASG